MALTSNGNEGDQYRHPILLHDYFTDYIQFAFMYSSFKYHKNGRQIRIHFDSTLEFLINVPGRLLNFGKFAGQEVFKWSFFQQNTKIEYILNVDYCSRTSDNVFCQEISPFCDHLAKYGSQFQEKFPPRTFIRDMTFIRNSRVLCYSFD